MKKQELWRKCQLLLIIVFGTYPLVMTVLNRFSPGILSWGWLFSGVFFALAVTGLFVKGRFRLAAGIFMAALMICGAFLLAPARYRLGALAASALCGALGIWSMKIAGWSKKQEIPVLWIACGVLSHLLGQLQLHVDRVAGGAGLAVHSGSFLVALYGFALLTLLSVNRDSLTAASGKRQNVPELMRRRNVLMILAFFVLSVLASLLPSAFSGIMDLLSKGIAWLVSFIAGLIPDAPTQQVEDVTDGTGMGTTAVGGDGAPIVLNPIVEKFMAVCGAIIFFALLLVVLYRLYRMAESGIRRLVESLGKFATSVSEDYVDEVTDTREDLTAEKIEKERLSSRLPFLEPRNLSPQERIRFRYRKLMRRHPEWGPGSTARETLPNDLAVLYERARYSAHPVSEAEADTFTDGSRSIS